MCPKYQCKWWIKTMPLDGIYTWPEMYMYICNSQTKTTTVRMDQFLLLWSWRAQALRFTHKRGAVNQNDIPNIRDITYQSAIWWIREDYFLINWQHSSFISNIHFLFRAPFTNMSHSWTCSLYGELTDNTLYSEPINNKTLRSSTATTKHKHICTLICSKWILL